MVHVAIDYDKTVKTLGNHVQRHLPYATSLALNNTAFEARTAVQDQMKKVFTIRKLWVLQGVRVDKSSKSQGRLGFYSAAVKHLDEKMTKQEIGGVVTPKRKAIAVPASGIRSSGKQSIPKGKRPRALLQKPNIFIAEIRPGHPSIYRRISRKKIKPLYVLRESAKYRPLLGFEKAVNEVVQRRFASNFDAAIVKALASAR